MVRRTTVFLIIDKWISHYRGDSSISISRKSWHDTLLNKILSAPWHERGLRHLHVYQPIIIGRAPHSCLGKDFVLDFSYFLIYLIFNHLYCLRGWLFFHSFFQFLFLFMFYYVSKVLFFRVFYVHGEGFLFFSHQDLTCHQFIIWTLSCFISKYFFRKFFVTLACIVLHFIFFNNLHCWVFFLAGIRYLTQHFSLHMSLYSM